MTTLYTIGNGKRNQFAMRADGVWFVRSRWHGGWSKWREHGAKRPFEFGMYIVPGNRQAKLPPIPKEIENEAIPKS